MLINNGRIIDPSQGIDLVGDILVINGKIEQIGQGLTSSNCPIINAAGMIVSPGFIDLHCHLRQPGFEEKETIATGTKAAARGGFTTICCMPNTNPPIDSRDMVKYIQETAAREGVVRVLPIGCITKGRAGGELVEMGKLADAGVVGFSDDGSPVENPKLMRQALEQSKILGLPIIAHCEDLSLTKGGLMNEGKVAAKLGFKGMPPLAEERIIARDISLAEQTEGRLHIAHVSTSGSVELIRQAKAKGISLTAEVTPHHLTLTEESVLSCGANAKVNPPLRTQDDINALIRGLEEGVINAIATDHAPHSEKDKAGDFGQAAFGISGLETALGSLLSLVHQGKISLLTLISKLTIEPARVLGIAERAGTLKTGSPADIVIFDPKAEWVVNPDEFASKGKNTPLKGATLKGKVMATVVGGKVVYLDKKLTN